MTALLPATIQRCASELGNLFNSSYWCTANYLGVPEREVTPSFMRVRVIQQNTKTPNAT